jgi:mannose-1-phosphate guanylyltransferase
MILPIFMAGGSGTRLWPLSRSMYPKQFISMHGKNTMFQETVLRVSDLNSLNPIIICNEEHRFIVAEQLQNIGAVGSIILEPEGRNTAPAIALAALKVIKKDDPLMLVLPADHIINDKNAFLQAVKKAIPIAESGGLVTFGITPNFPNTEYGYIKCGESFKSGYSIEQFIEKPNEEKAKQFFDSGEYLWNSGMFLFKASTYLEELKKYRPKIFLSCKASMEEVSQDMDFTRINSKEFLKCSSESIDYAVMENTKNSFVLPMNVKWNDLGSWSSVWDENNKDKNGNATIGESFLENTSNSLVYGKDRLIAAMGIEDTIIVDTKDVLLVANKEKVKNIKKIVDRLKKEKRPEVDFHRVVYRPWGKFDSIDNGKRYQVKRITVNPGSKLSVQKHLHRSEHWVVVSGTAEVTNGDETFILKENESTYIPVGVIHALKNPEKVPLELIEIQSGSYLGEDDIIRYEDIYGRS